MRDIPMFCTQLGAASLILQKIPYTRQAYILIRDSVDKMAFLEECRDFCIAAGAEQIYAAGDAFLAAFAHHTTIIKMQCSRELLRDTEAMLFPVQEKTAEYWRKLYNEKMRHVPNSSYMTARDAQMRIDKGQLYFVHNKGTLLGIGAVDGGSLDAVASCVPGAGESVVLALCSLITEPVVTLTVAKNNLPAVALYERLGFVSVAETENWYKIL